MNKDIKNIFKNYKQILENTDISNNMSGSGASTKYTVDHMARFLPIGQDDEEKKINSQDEYKNKLKEFFTTVKALVDLCQSDRCKSSDIGKLLDLMDSPAAKADLTEYKNILQIKDQNNGNNTKLSS
jgi:hypothetical protein